MPLVTVIGASSRTFAVTVDGTHALRLKGQYENAINNLQGVGKNSTIGGGTSLPITSSMAVGNGHVDNKMLMGITTMSTVSGSNVAPVSGNSLGTIVGGVVGLTTVGGSASSVTTGGSVSVGPVMGSAKINGGHEAVIGDDNKDHVKVTVSAASGIVYDDPDDLHQHNNFTFDTTNGTVSGDWGDTISAVGDPKVYPEESANVSVGGSLAFIGREQLDDKRNTTTVNGGVQYLEQRVRDVDLDTSSVYSGSEDKNIFDFVNSSSSNYTIADFGKSAGNKVEQNGVSKIVFNDNSHVVTGLPSLTLDDGTKITFSGMTDGNNIPDDDFFF